MEAKRFRVNSGMTKGMKCRMRRVQSEDSLKNSCGVCRKGVGSNSILCVECLGWVHKRCSGIKGKLKSNVDFRCRRCLDEGLVGTVLQRETLILNPT